MSFENPLRSDICCRCFKTFGLLLKPPDGIDRPEEIMEEEFFVCPKCKLQLDEEMDMQKKNHEIFKEAVNEYRNHQKEIGNLENATWGIEGSS